MRHRLSLALLIVLVVFAILATTRYFSARSQASRVPVAATDTVSVVDVPREIDTTCIASRLGLPCATR